jgi:hypothetical protein
MTISKGIVALAGLGIAASAANAQFDFDVVGGQTSVLLDTNTLSAAASLDLSGVAGDTIAPGELGAGSVAFPINPRDAASLPTTFSYDAGLANFGGTIEHTGSVLFNSDTVEVGNFTIGFDANRATGNNSGFFVESTTGIAAILFDVEAPSGLVADGTGLQITANLLVSPEFAGFLTDNGLASTNLTGADVGDAFVNAAIPAPGAAGVLALAGLAASRRRR